MFEITVIGLGAGEKDLSRQGEQEIINAKLVVARTALTGSFSVVKKLNPSVVALDYVYEKSRNFDTLNKNLASEVIKLSKTSPVCYVVDGSSVQDNSVKYLLEKVNGVKLYAGVSAGSKCLERLNKVETDCQSVSAYSVVGNYGLTLPLVVYALDSKIIASEVKLWLSNIFGDDAKAFVTSDQEVQEISLYELDRLSGYDYSFSVYIPNLALTDKKRFNFNDVMEILTRLRAPNGCPWDREQTETTILKNVIEEAYELVDAVLSGDDFSIIEETGDLILQSAFYVCFGEEGSRYSRYDVFSDLCEKLISRHTHVFGGDTAVSASDALSVWNKNKVTEKGFDTAKDYVCAVPSAMPSVMRAEKVGKRAGKYGFDFASVDDAIEKVYEEVLELKQAIKSGDKTATEKECGDLLFSAVNVVRKAGVDGELALKNSTEKFIERFGKLEGEIIAQGKDFSSLSASELDDIYNLIKRR